MCCTQGPFTPPFPPLADVPSVAVGDRPRGWAVLFVCGAPGQNETCAAGQVSQNGTGAAGQVPQNGTDGP